MDLQEQHQHLQALTESALIVDAHQAQRRLNNLWPPKNPEHVSRAFEDLRQRLEQSAATSLRRGECIAPPSFPEALPITARKDEIIDAIINNQVVVLAGETGSGKTTQIPKMCIAAGRGRRGQIGCTQPRRIAALSVAQRIAEELKTPLGRGVGSKIRFNEKTSEDTQIKLMTDGILLNELQQDPLLLKYDTIIIDEAHERSLNIDFILGALRQLIKKRRELKLIITSATIDTKTFSEAFDKAPVISVSGRTYPVEVRYRPLEEDADEDGEISYISSAKIIAEEILNTQPAGDILIFMPTEKDIRDSIRQLERHIPQRRAQILPLFGRMNAGEQQAIFATSNRTKIIVATNIAETSITIPGIRYVIDSGLARTSRFSAHTATRRLPIEPISQSSAKQRAGRSGRVQNGVCYRLYDEREFESRPEFSTPEILRADLADVILRMAAFRLGSMDTFPFIQPPDAKAVRGGYRVLEELGAIERKDKNTEWRLTQTGRQLARLPVDPSVGRMILAGQEHGCLPEVLVIAAGLSIQDPRDVPADKREAARQAQREFTDKESDFLAYLKMWHALLGPESKRPSNKVLKQFCTKHFLSFQRMREWMEVHQQLAHISKDFFETAPPLGDIEALDPEGIHKSILTGCIGNIAQKEDGNQYRATHGRKVSLFPASSLYDKKIASRDRKGSNQKVTQTTRHGSSPEWVMCAEWMETSRLFARTCAKINPDWVSTLAPHLIRKTYSDPQYHQKSGRVISREKHLLYGLVVNAKQVAYHPIDSEAATDIFIREGILADQLPMQIREIEKNKQIVAEAEEALARKRQSSSFDFEERLYRFYSERLPQVSDVHTLKKWIRTAVERTGNPIALTTDYLLGTEAAESETEHFPKKVSLSETTLDVSYAYKPGEEEDGATLKVGLNDFHKLNQGILDWIIPGYIEERIEHLIRALPKDIRRQLQPIAENTRAIAQRVKPAPQTLVEILTKILWEDFRIRVGPTDWNLDRVPDHLKPRIEITDTKGKTAVASGRDWESVQKSYQSAIEQQTRSGKGVDKFKAWKRAEQEWATPPLQDWPSPKEVIPPSIDVCVVGGVPVIAFPALLSEDNGVALRLLKTQAEAQRANQIGMGKLTEFAISKELGWLQKDLKDLKKIGPAITSLAASETVIADAFANIRRHLIFDSPIRELSKTHLDERSRYAAQEIKGIAYKALDYLKPIVELRHRIATTPANYDDFHKDMLRTAPKDFLKRTPFARLQHLERYLKGYLLRNDRAKNNRAKDLEKYARVAPLHSELVKLIQKSAKQTQIRAEVQTLFWMLEEFRISLFCQELGTAEKISEKRIQQHIDRVNAQAL